MQRFKPKKKLKEINVKKAHKSKKETEKLIKEIQKVNSKNLSKARMGHTCRVIDTAVCLAKRYGADPNRVAIAAAFHDMAKELTKEDHKEIAKAFGLQAKYANNRALGHGKIAARLAEDLWGIEDKKILNAISYHTTGREGMSLEEKLVFLADLLEPARSYPRIKEIRKTLDKKGVDAACLKALRGVFVHIKKLDRKSKIDDDGLRAYAWFRNKERKKR